MAMLHVSGAIDRCFMKILCLQVPGAVKQVKALARVSHQTHGFKPVEKVLLEKLVRGVSVNNVLLTLCKMTSSIAASILQLRWQTASNGPYVDLAPQHSRAYKAAHVLTKAAVPRHKLKAARY